MQKIYLQKIKQHGHECYIGKIDPRVLVNIATKVEMSQTQDAQRPLNEKRVKSIANYVEDENGILPNTLTIATKDNRLPIELCKETPSLYYTYIPNTSSEFENFTDAVDVMDGQHRLYSFLSTIRTIPDTEDYEIGFTLYDKPSLTLRRKIFISCNEKQEKVSANLLIWFKEKLDMLDKDEKRYYDIVHELANEFPLKGHIIMSAEKVKNGVKAKEIMEELKKAKILNMSASGSTLTNEKILKVLTTYFSAWQTVADFEFSKSTAKEAGVAIKMAGLRYMIHLLPAVWDYAISSKEKFTQAFVEDTLRRMIDGMGIEHNKIFVCEENNQYFRDRTMTIKFSEQCIDRIKKLNASTFDPI